LTSQLLDVGIGYRKCLKDYVGCYTLRDTVLDYQQMYNLHVK